MSRWDDDFVFIDTYCMVYKLATASQQERLWSRNEIQLMWHFPSNICLKL